MACSDWSILLPGFLTKRQLKNSQLWSRRCCVFPCKINKFLMEMNESIDISGLPERNVHGSVIMAVHDSEDAERMTKYKLTPGL